MKTGEIWIHRNDIGWKVRIERIYQDRDDRDWVEMMTLEDPTANFATGETGSMYRKDFVELFMKER